MGKTKKAPSGESASPRWIVTANVVGGKSFGEIAASDGAKAIEQVRSSEPTIALCAKCAPKIECPAVDDSSYVARKVGGDGEVHRAGAPPTSSAAMVFLQHLWDNSQKATGHSWTRLNTAMYRAVTLAIEAGLFFDIDDFDLIYKEFRGGYWFGEQNGEGWYGTAIEYSNESACLALEKMFGRKPIVFDGRRIAVGTQIWWPEREVPGGAVTSFKDDKESVIVCTYAIDPVTSQRSQTPTRRITIRRDEFVEREKARKGKVSLDNDMRAIRQCLLRIAGDRYFPTPVTAEMLSTIEKWPAGKRKSVREWCAAYWSKPMPAHLKELLPETAQQAIDKRVAAAAA
ncbi:hypothetical protein EKK58_05550 [Candidatus Dependentiae bacterium]|nr:MAG: hypothetical protein EKK58_05550 [Candidatus Dependentiae bacterium]